MLRHALSSALATTLAVAGGALVSVPAGHAQVNADVVCAEWDEATRSCLLELEVALDGDPRTVTASVAEGGGGQQVWCDRGAHYNPDPGSAHLEQVPCRHPDHGWYSQIFDCYFTIDRKVSPDDERVIVPGGHEVNDQGAVYAAMCYTASHGDIPSDNYCFDCTPPDWFPPVQYVFLESEPDGFGGTEDPVPGLLVEAIEVLALEGPTIGTAPPAGSETGLVRLPVWLWNEVSPNNWGTPSQTAGPIAGISVVAQAEATGIVWDMGDGNTVECDEGVAYEVGMPVYQPPCGHPYGRPSRDQPSGEYQISAATTWVLEWTTQGLPEERGGEFELEAVSTTSLQINELQVLYGS